MAKSWKGKKAPINRDASPAKVRAVRQARLRKLRAKEGIGGKESSAFDDAVEIATKKGK